MPGRAPACGGRRPRPPPRLSSLPSPSWPPDIVPITRWQARQLARYGEDGATSNTGADPAAIELTPDAQALAEQAMDRLKFSPRGCSRTLRVARRIADLASNAFQENIRLRFGARLATLRRGSWCQMEGRKMGPAMYPSGWRFPNSAPCCGEW